MGGFTDLSRDLSIPFAQGGAQGNQQALGMNTFRQQKMIEQQMALDLMKQRAQAQQDLQMNVLKQKAEIDRKNRESEIGAYNDALKTQAETEKVRSEMPGPGPQPYQHVQTPAPSPLNPEGKGIQMWPGMETLYNTLFNGENNPTPQQSPSNPPPYIQVPQFRGGRAELVAKPNPVAKSATSGAAKGEFSRASQLLEEFYREQGLQGQELIDAVAEGMRKIKGGQAKTVGEEGTVGRYGPGPARDARVDTAGATTQKKIDVENDPRNAQQKANTAATVETAKGRAASDVQLEPAPMQPGAPPPQGPPMSRAQAVTTERTMGQGLEAGEKKQFAELYTLRDVAKTARSMSGDFSKPYFGYLHNLWASAMENYFNDTKMLKGALGEISSEEIEVRAHLRSMSDALLRARSGAQINEQEFQRLMRFLPAPEMPASVAKARMNAFERELEIIIKSKEAQQGRTQGSFNQSQSPSPQRTVPPQPTQPTPNSGWKVLR